MDRRRAKASAFVPGPQRSRQVPMKRVTEPRKKSAGSLPNMDKNSMLIIEANEIAQYLKKDYEFEMCGEGIHEEHLIQVRVRQKALAISCVWPLSKLKERLMKMRKLMYASEAEGQGLGCDSVFFDPKDIWIKDETIQNPGAVDPAEETPNKNSESNHPSENGHISDTSSTSSNKENASPTHQGNVVNHRGNNSQFGRSNPTETLSNETALPSVSVSVAFNSSAGSNKFDKSPSSVNGDTSLMNGSAFNSTASSELPADSEFLTMSMTSPMSPPPPNRDFGRNSGGMGSQGALPEKYFTSSGKVKPGDLNDIEGKNKNFPPSPNKSNSSSSPPPLDLQHGTHTPIIKKRSPNVTASPNSLKASRKTKKKESGLPFNLDLQKSSQIPSNSVVPKEPVHQAPKSGNKNCAISSIQKNASSSSAKSVVNSSNSSSKNDGLNSSSEKKTQPYVCQKCGSSKSDGMAVVKEKHEKPSRKGISMMRMCRDMVQTLSYRCKGAPRHDSLVDRILYNCEVIKVAVINILEAYTQAQDRKINIATFADSELIKLTSIQLVAALELLVSHTSLWASSFNEVDSGLVREMCTQIHRVVKDLGKEMVLFLQACETDQDTVASESATKIIDQLYELLRHCGELALATETCPSLLVDKRPASLQELKALRHQRDDDLLNMKPSCDVKQAFMMGCDLWMDRHLHSTAATLEHSERQAQMLSEDCYASQCSEEVGKQVYITVATTKILVLKCQDIQVAVSHNMKEDSQKPDNYFYHYFMRNQGVLANLATLVDSVALLCQAADPLADEEDPGALKKVCRCAEMIYKSALKLVLSSSTDNQSAGGQDSLHSSVSSFSSINGLSLETAKLPVSDNKGISIVLSEAQCDQIEQSGEDVKLATQALVALIKKRLPADSANNSGKIKRLLPATPGGGRGQILRCKSAKYPDRIRRSISYYDVGSTGDM